MVELSIRPCARQVRHQHRKMQKRGAGFVLACVSWYLETYGCFKVEISVIKDGKKEQIYRTTIISPFLDLAHMKRN